MQDRCLFFLFFLGIKQKFTSLFLSTKQFLQHVKCSLKWLVSWNSPQTDSKVFKWWRHGSMPRLICRFLSWKKRHCSLCFHELKIRYCCDAKKEIRSKTIPSWLPPVSCCFRILCFSKMFWMGDTKTCKAFRFVPVEKKKKKKPGQILRS